MNGLTGAGFCFQPLLVVATCIAGGDFVRLTTNFRCVSLSNDSVLCDRRSDVLLLVPRATVLTRETEVWSVLGSVFFFGAGDKTGLVGFSKGFSNSFFGGGTLTVLRTGKGGAGSFEIGDIALLEVVDSRYEEGTQPSTPSKSTNHHPVAFLVMTLTRTPEVKESPSSILVGLKSPMVT